MPGLGLSLTQDEVTPSLTALQSEKLGNKIVFGAVTALAALAQRAFDEPGLRPSPWAPRKSGGTHPLLLKSGTLRQSIHAARAGDGKAEVRIPVAYATVQQFGSSKTSGRGSGIPARPFFPATKDGQLTERAITTIEQVAKVLIEKAARDGIA